MCVTKGNGRLGGILENIYCHMQSRFLIGNGMQKKFGEQRTTWTPFFVASISGYTHHY